MNKFLIIHVIFGLLFFSCGEDKKKINESSAAENQVLDDAGLPLPNVTFFQYGDSSSYPDAILELYTPLGNQVFKPGKVPFEFNVKNFDLQKSGGESRLFMILNGGDPIGYLAPIFQRELTVGTYRAVAYLVDEEGLALKSFGNYVDRDFLVGDSRPFPYSAEPYLAVHQPKNAQLIPFGEELVIDFLVLGGDMKLDGLKVKVFVNEFSHEVDRMAPIRVANLPKGDYQVKVQLVRKDNKEMEGPFSSISKTVFVR
jgi:hypothetical protein